MLVGIGGLCGVAIGCVVPAAQPPRVFSAEPMASNLVVGCYVEDTDPGYLGCDYYLEVVCRNDWGDGAQDCRLRKEIIHNPRWENPRAKGAMQPARN